MRDVKYEMFLIADEFAYEKYGHGFYDLSQEQQTTIWKRAEEEWADREIAKAERLIDELGWR